MKTRIAVDVDNVICVHHHLTIDAINQKFSVDANPEEVDEYDYAAWYYKKWPKLGKAKLQSAVNELVTSSEHLSKAAPSLPMLIAMRELSGMSLDGNGVTIVTSRPMAMRDATKLFLDKHGIAYHKLVHTEEKGLYCRSNAVTYLVEDNPSHINAARAAGISVFIIDFPYNREIEATGTNGLWRIINAVDIPKLIRDDYRP